MKEQFSEVIFKALKAVEYSGKEDNNKFKSAVRDLSTKHTYEGKFVSRVVDDEFISICCRVFTCEKKQVDAIKRNASDYLQNNQYHTSKEYSDTMSDQIVNGFLKYAGKDDYIDFNSIRGKTPDDFRHYMPRSKTVPAPDVELDEYDEPSPAPGVESDEYDEPTVIRVNPVDTGQPDDAQKPRIGVVVFVILCLLAFIGAFYQYHLLEKDDATSENTSIDEPVDSDEGITYTDNRIAYTDSSVSVRLPGKTSSNSFFYTGQFFDVRISIEYGLDHSAFPTYSEFKELETILIDGKECYWTEEKGENSFSKRLYMPIEMYGQYDKLYYVCIETTKHLVRDDEKDNIIKIEEEYFNRIINEAKYTDKYEIIAEGSVLTFFGLQIPGYDLEYRSTAHHFTEINLDDVKLTYGLYNDDNGLTKTFNDLKAAHDQLFTDNSEVDYYYVDSGDTIIDGVEGKWITYNRERDSSITGEYYLLIPDDKNERMLTLELEFSDDISKQTGSIDEIVGSSQFVE